MQRGILVQTPNLYISGNQAAVWKLQSGSAGVPSCFPHIGRYLVYFSDEKESGMFTYFRKKGRYSQGDKNWRDDTMDKKRVITCLTVLLLVLALAGIFYYISYVNNSAPAKRGTLVRAFSQKVNECCV